MPPANVIARPSPALPSPARSREAPAASGAPKRPFARVETSGAIEEASAVWAELAQSAAASPYQSFAFARIWFGTIGAAEGVRPLIVVARDESGAPVALAPLALRQYGPLRLASFLGGKDANFNLGLFRPDLSWSRADVEALFREAGRQASPRVDAFLLTNQPLQWRGLPNPLAEMAHQPSPSFAYKSALPADFAQWLDAHASKDTKKKMRKKRARLEATAPLAHGRAADPEAIKLALAAFHAQRRARVAALGLPDPYGSGAAQEFLERLALEGALELHTMTLGERIIAVFGALAGVDRLSGLFVANDSDPEIARSSPGELMVHATVADAIARGFREFDLGVGEARYKNESCEQIETLFDSAFAISLLGRLAARTFLAAQRIKRVAKQSPRLKAFYAWLRRNRGAEA